MSETKEDDPIDDFLEDIDLSADGILETWDSEYSMGAARSIKKMVARIRGVRSQALRETPAQTWASGVEAAIETIVTRANVENHVVAPGMWVAAGTLKQLLLNGPTPPADRTEDER